MTAVFNEGTFVGRIWRPDVPGPSVVVDITSPEIPTMSDLLELDDPVGFVRTRQAVRVEDLGALLSRRPENADPRLLAPDRSSGDQGVRRDVRTLNGRTSY